MTVFCEGVVDNIGNPYNRPAFGPHLLVLLVRVLLITVSLGESPLGPGLLGHGVLGQCPRVAKNRDSKLLTESAPTVNCPLDLLLILWQILYICTTNQTLLQTFAILKIHNRSLLNTTSWYKLHVVVEKCPTRFQY